MRSACDSERPTTVTHGQSWSLGDCQHGSAQSAFALVRALGTSSELVVRGRVELPTFRFSGRATASNRASDRRECSGHGSSSLLDCLGWVRRVKAVPHAVAARALTRRPRPEGRQLSRRMGEEQGTAMGTGRTAVRRAISLAAQGTRHHAARYTRNLKLAINFYNNQLRGSRDHSLSWRAPEPAINSRCLSTAAPCEPSVRPSAGRSDAVWDTLVIGSSAAPLPVLGPGLALRSGSACHRTIWAELTATTTATAAANRCQQRPATAHNARAIRANWGYVRPKSGRSAST